MSRFFGAIGALSEADKLRFSSLSSGTLFSYSTDRFLVAASGINATCIHNLNDDSSGFIVCGRGISGGSESLHPLNKQEWRDLLATDILRFSALNGHFAGITWSGRDCTFFTDRLGLREILLNQQNGVLYFATDDKDLTQLSGHSHEINWDAFSARWLLINQLSLDSIIKDTTCLISGASANVRDGVVDVRRSPPLPLSADVRGDCEYVSSVLQGFITLPGGPKLLALSGGMDSRLILSYLLRQEDHTFIAYSFEERGHPDRTIPAQMAADLGFAHETATPSLVQDDDALLRQIKKYFLSKKVTTTLAHFLASEPYDRFQGATGTLIDGGFGEIGRRRFHERLRVRNAEDILSGDPLKIFPLLHRSRADIFDASLTQSLVVKAQQQLAEYISTAPSAQTIGVDQWLDLMAVRTILPNNNRYEQTRLDGIVANFCPFTQPVFIEAILATPLDLRRNGKLYRKIIRTNDPRLSKYPLVKFETTYPYMFGAVGASVWTSVKKMLGKAHASTAHRELLHRLKPFVYDTASSQQVKEVAAYDYNKIRTIVDGYYAGNQAYAGQLDWWLSFELWRESLSI